MLYLLKEDGYRLLQETGDKINLETLLFLIDVVDNVTITDVWVTLDFLDLTVSDTINITEIPEVIISEYVLNIYDQININEGSLNSILTLDSYSESNVNAYYPEYSGSSTAWLGQAFTTLNDGVYRNLDSCKFFSNKAGSPTGDMTARLYEVTGTPGSTAKPTGSPLATSDVFDSSLAPTSGLFTFNFSGAERYLLVPNTNYIITVQYSGGDTNNKVNIGLDSTSPTHAGNLSYSANGTTWGAIAGYDLIFYVYGAKYVPNVVIDLIIDVSDTLITFEGPTNVSYSATPAFPVTVTQQAFGTVQWVNPDNIKIEDGSFTTMTLAAETSYELLVSNFGFTIPSNAIITGIKLEVKGKNLNGAGLGVFEIGAGDGQYIALTTTNDWQSYGGSSTTWGISYQNFKPAYINSSAFGFSLLPENGDPLTDTISLDAARVTIYYNVGGLPVIQMNLGDISISDSINTTEFLDQNIETLVSIMNVSVIDNVSITENLDILLTSYNIDVSENVSITESTTLENSNLGNINVFDSISITEVFTTEYTVMVFDGKTASRWAYMESSASRSVARDSAGNVYVVFNAYDATFGYQIWIAKSTDGGTTWTGGANEKMIATNFYGNQYSPKIAIDSTDHIYVAWTGLGATINTGVVNVKLKYGTFANLNSQPVITVTDSAVAQGTVAIAVDSNDDCNIVWAGLGLGTNSTIYQILHRKFTPSGSSTDVVNLTDEPSNQILPDIAIDSFNNIHLVWYGIYTGEATWYKILYQKYDYNTGVWGSVDKTLIPAGSSGYYPSIAIDSNNKVHVSYWSGAFYIRYSNLVSGSWAAPTSIIYTTGAAYIPRSSIALDKQDNIYIVAEVANSVESAPIHNICINRYRNGAWQQGKFVSFESNYQNKPSLLWAMHPMTHKQQNVPLLGTMGVWINSTSAVNNSFAGDVFLFKDIDLTWQSDLYVNVHSDINISENNQFLLLQLYVPDVYDSVVVYEGTSLSQGPNSPATTVNLKNSTLIDSYPDSNRSSTISPFRSGSFVDVGQPFFNTTSSYLDSATFYLTKVLAPTGNATAKLYAMTGTYGTDAKPTGAALATSDNYDITGTLGLVNFTFSGAERILLTPNTYYCILVNFSGVTGDASNYMGFGTDSSTPSHGGNIFYSSGGAYSVNTAWDAIFYVYSTNINDVAWSDPDNSQVSDNVYSTSVLPEVEMFANDPLVPGEWTNEFSSRLGSYQNWSQSFTNATPVILDRIVWPLNKVGAPTGNVYAKIYAHSGTYGTSSKPTGEPLAISDPIDITTIPVQADYYFTYVPFTFSGDQRISLDGNTYYCAVLDIQGGIASNYLSVPNDYTGTTASGNGAYSHDGITYTVTGDGYLYVYGVTTSQYLKASNFGFSIPTGRTILGIKVDIEQKTTGSTEENTVKIVKADGTIGTTNRSTRANLPGTDTYVTYGSHLDLWGETWTAANINDADFGVVFATDGIGTSSVDHIRITVYYSTMRPDVMLESQVSVYDLVNITEDVTGENPALIDLNDSISISESVTAQISSMEINVSDSITISESSAVTISLLGNINIIDSITVSESITVTNSNLNGISVSDQVNITENTTIFFLNWVINVSDLINVVDYFTGSGVFILILSDNITISESVSLTLSQLGGINVFDSINITESIQSQTPQLGGISVFDSVTITESIQTQTPQLGGVNVSDSINITENTTIFFRNWNINISDLINISENLNNYGFSHISVNDNVTISESVNTTILELGNISIFDSITITENQKIEEISIVNVLDLVNITESNTLTNSQLGGINVFDSVNIVDNFIGSGIHVILANDLININESVILQMSSLGDINVSDSINITETSTWENPLIIIVVDSINISESISSQLSTANISVFDLINISENLSGVRNLIVSIFDSINITELITSEISTANISVFDSINISETTGGETPFSINVYDNVNLVGESNDIYDDPNISFDEILTQFDGNGGDYVRVEISSNIIVIDYINITDTTTTSSSDLSINIFDLINISENLAGAKNLIISIFDSINISESISSQLSTANISVFDLINISENLSEVSNLAIVVFDSINISESISSQLSTANISVFDSINISENLSGTRNLTITVFDNIIIEEIILINITNPTISVYDLININENIDVETSSLLISTYDALSITDNNNTFLSDPSIFIYDYIYITDNFSGFANINLSIIDSILITEYINTDLISNINTNDNVIISEWTKLEKFRVSHSIKRPHGSGHSIGTPQGSINTIGTPSGNTSSIGTPTGRGSSIRTPSGSMKTVGRPTGGVD